MLNLEQMSQIGGLKGFIASINGIFASKIAANKTKANIFVSSSAGKYFGFTLNTVPVNTTQPLTWRRFLAKN